MGNANSRYDANMQKRGQELKTMLNEHVRTFVDKHCELGPLHFVPMKTLNNAWDVYAKNNGFLDELYEYYGQLRNEYYYDGLHVKHYGGIWWNDNVIKDKGMYIGISLKSWPDTM